MLFTSCSEEDECLSVMIYLAIWLN